MFPNPINTYDVKLMEQRELVATAIERNRHTTTAVPARGMSSLNALREIFAAALDRFALLLPDSRDTLRSKELELAAVGVTWNTDPAHDEMLANQIEAARLQRRAAYPATQDVLPPATSSLYPSTSLTPQSPAVPAQA
jgi:hypothetical protein